MSTLDIDLHEDKLGGSSLPIYYVIAKSLGAMLNSGWAKDDSLLDVMGKE